MQPLSALTFDGLRRRYKYPADAFTTASYLRTECSLSRRLPASRKPCYMKECHRLMRGTSSCVPVQKAILTVSNSTIRPASPISVCVGWLVATVASRARYLASRWRDAVLSTGNISHPQSSRNCGTSPTATRRGPKQLTKSTSCPAIWKALSPSFTGSRTSDFHRFPRRQPRGCVCLEELVCSISSIRLALTANKLDETRRVIEGLDPNFLPDDPDVLETCM